MDELNLLTGDIKKSLIKLSLPIMLTSFMQMAYNIIDMFWVGKLGSIAIAAVGTGGFYMWFIQGVIILIVLGSQIKVAYSLGKKDYIALKAYVRSSFQLVFLFSVVSTFVMVVFRKELIGFFNFTDPNLLKASEDYLFYIGMGISITFLVRLFSSLWNGYGNSKYPFISVGVGLLSNIILDPIFIHVLDYGVKGAAIATVLAQMFSLIIYLFMIRKNPVLFKSFNFFKIELSKLIDLLRLGFANAMQSMAFTFIAMIIARIVSVYGPEAIAAQRLGTQIESISWMSADGFSVATSTFIAQNYGANLQNRIKKGFNISLTYSAIIGLIASILFFVFAKDIYYIFLDETQTVNIGNIYLKILALSQVFMCVEIVSRGAFNGFGKTVYPAFIGILFNALRIPLALILASYFMLGLDGIWWAITITTIFKGTILLISFYIYLKSKQDVKVI